MTEYNRISDGNFTPTSNGKNNKHYANLLPCDNMNNECDDQAYNSLPPMSSPCYDQPPNRSITNTNNAPLTHEDGRYTGHRNSEDSGPMSPRVPPMAFTIDFGNEETSESSTPKRLGLRDGIGRFAPSKKFLDRPKSPRHVPAAKNIQTPPSAASTTATMTTSSATIDLLSLKNTKINHLLLGDAARGNNDYISQTDSNKHENVEVNRSDAGVMSLETEYVKGIVTQKEENASLHNTTNFVTTATRERVSPVDVVIDEENNIASNEATFNTTNNTLERSGSEAGTYTIDNDEEENNIEEQAAKNIPSSKDIHGKASDVKENGGVLGGGIKDQKINTNEWVNMWATHNSLIMNKDNREVDDNTAEPQYEDDFEEEEEESSLSSIRGGEGDTSRSRRKLPTVPSPTNRVGINNNSVKTMNSNISSDPAKHDPNTDDYLKDTISLMASMEARLSNGDEEGQRQQHLQRSSTHHSQSQQPYNSRPIQQPPKFRPSSGLINTPKPSNKLPSTTHSNVKGNVPAGSAASIEQAKKAKELAAWKARKNYDPLRAANNNKKTVVPHQQQFASSSSKRPSTHALVTNNEGDVDSYSEDTCSDLDAASSVSQQAYSNRHQPPSHASPAHRYQPSLQARTNRAFALRQTNSLQINENIVQSSVGAPGSTINGSPKRTPSEESFSRSDGGRWSLRNKKNGVTKNTILNTSKSAAMNSSIHRVQPSTKKKSMGVRNVMNGGRSTSSLSSREAEFQAWKRRKNYDPLRSAQSAGKQRTTIQSSSVTSNVSSTVQTQVAASPSQHIRRGTITKATSAFQQTNQASSSIQPRDAMGDYSNLLRSASFHYPDGLSRVQLNVYTSEEDDDSQVGVNGDFPAGLYEVNEDELILTIGGGGGNDNCSESVISMRPSSSKNQLDANRGSPSSMSHWPPSANSMQTSHKMTRSSPSRGSSNKLEALDNLVISTIFSVSAKLCLTSSTLMRQLQEQTTDKEQLDYLDTLLYVLEDVDPPMSPSKKTSRELAGTLRNLKKVEQALQTLLTSDNPLTLAEDPSEEAENEN